MFIHYYYYYHCYCYYYYYCSRLKNRNNVIGEIINIKNSVLDYKDINSGYVRRMNEERLPRRILEWCTPERKRKGDD